MQPLIFLPLLLFSVVITDKVNSHNALPLNNSYSVLVEQPDSHRLNNEIIPIRYEVDLTIPENFTETKTFSGIVKIIIGLKPGVTSTDKRIKLNVKNITLDKVDELKLYPASGGNLLKTKPKPVPDDALETLTLLLKEGNRLKKTEQYTIRIKYTGSFQTDTNGFFLTSYKDENNRTERLAVTNFQPTHARKAFPCFDEPNLKATFKITVIHPHEYQIISNSELLRASPKDHMTESIFKDTPKIPTYTVALVLSKFGGISSFNDIVGVNSVWSKQNLILSANYAFDVGPRIIKEINNITKIDFNEVFPKLDQIAVPNLQSAFTGNLALAIYRESALLWHPTESTLRSKQAIATNIARTLSSMWFGNLVTVDWWSYAWLSEGLACYFAHFVTSKLEHEWASKHHFIITEHQHALENDIFTSGEPLSSSEEVIFTPEHISDKFDAVTCSKGGAVIRMMENFMGTQYFIAGIREYLENNLFMNTRPEQLWKALTRNLDPSKNLSAGLDSIMKTWTEQPVFPVVTARIKGSNVVLSQEVYSIGKTKQNQNIYKWYIPISYTTSNEKQIFETTPKLWMKPQDNITVIEDVIESNTTWIIVNVQNLAYVRVNYDKATWKAMERALKIPLFDGIHFLSRAQLVDDVMNLARVGFTSYNVALQVTSYLEDETDYHPWLSAFKAFEYLMIRLQEDTDAVELLNVYLLNLMQKFYSNSMNLEDVDPMSVYKQELSSRWACRLGNTRCIKEALELFNSYVKFNKRIQPHLRGTVYCTALHYLEDLENWTFLRQQLNKIGPEPGNDIILNALGCVRNKTILKQYLQESIDPKSGISQQDRKTVLESVILGNQENVLLAFDFLKDNLKEIIEYYGGIQTISSTMVLLSKRLNQQKLINEFKQFLYENKERLIGISRTLKVALEYCEENLYWNQQHKKEVVDYLYDKISMTTTATMVTSLSTPPGGTGDNNTSISVLPTVNIIVIHCFVVLFCF